MTRFIKSSRLFTATVLAASLLCLASCSSDDSDAEEVDIDISEIYGYTFEGTIGASSGNTLTPALILYDENRCDWNMSTNGMEFNKFYYWSKKNSAGSYTLYWYSGSRAASASLRDESYASMVVQLGINSLNQVTVLLTSDSLTGVSGMTNTRVPMTRTSAEKNTTAPLITVDSSIVDVTITVPDTAETTDWFEGSSEYSGTFDFLVGEGGSLTKDHGTTDAAGNKTATVKITRSTSGKVTVSTPPMYYSSTMNITSYGIADVEVKKDGDVYYLTKGSYTQQIEQSNGSTITINGDSVQGKYENGVLTLRIQFKPGKMPFPITQIFTSGEESN